MSDDDDIWSAYAKGVKPIPKPKASRSAKAKIALTKKPVQSPASRIPANAPAAVLDNRPLDRQLERRLRQGEIEIDARIDLHGMFQEQAHAALDDFLARNVKAGKRIVLVITGKGRGGEGVLRANLPRWLGASLHVSAIMGLRPAAVRHGGDGAFYILLRRNK